LFAAALGIKVTDRTDVDRLSSQIDREKQRRKEKPSKGCNLREAVKTGSFEEEID